jgi:hypothetical protein
MCIVSRKNNYIFFHIPKCGGTSVSEILPNKEKVRLIEHTHLDYVNTKLVFEENNELDWFNKANKFAIIRNPFERTISLYKYIKQHKDHNLHNRLINYDFTQFCYFLKNIGDDSITSCYEHLSDDNGFIDDSIKIFKLEELNNHFKEISEIIGVEINEIPHINKSNYFFKKTEESDLLIEDIFLEDFEIFYKELL